MKKILILISLLLSSVSWAAITAVVDTSEAFGIKALAVTQDGSLIVAAVTDGSIRIFKASSGKLDKSIKMHAAVKAIALTDNSTKLIVASDKLFIVSLESLEYEVLNDKSRNISSLAADKGGKTLVFATGSVLTFYNTASGKETFTVRVPSEVYAVAFDDVAQTVYAGGKDGAIRVYSAVNGSLTAEKKAGVGVILSLASSNTGVVVGGTEGVKLFNKELAEADAMFRHTDDVRSVDITPDGRFAVSGGDDGMPVVWDIAGGDAVNSPLDKKAAVKAVAIDPYFRYIVSGTDESLVLQYTSNKNEVRNIYAFRDATATLNKVGYVDGSGPFGKYISYFDGSKTYSFADASKTVHQPQRLEYSMPQPRVAKLEPKSKPVVTDEFDDITPPEITVSVRGLGVVSGDEIRTVEGAITDESGIEWATIDGRALTLDARGRFKAEYAVSESRNVVIAAADIYGNTASKTVAISSGASAPEANAGRKVALIIGINSYKNLASLTTPEYDSRTVAELLNAVHGYETTLLLGSKATRDAILTEINSLRRSLTEHDRLIIYYAGHGELDKASGNAYWQPYDAMPGDDTRWIHTLQLTSTLSSFVAPVLVVSDSCYSGALRAKAEGAGSVVLISSGGNEPVSDKGGGDHSVFTGAFVMTLRTKQVKADEVFSLISAALKSKGQTPEYHIINGDKDYFF